MIALDRGGFTMANNPKKDYIYKDNGERDYRAEKAIRDSRAAELERIETILLGFQTREIEARARRDLMLREIDSAWRGRRRQWHKKRLAYGKLHFRDIMDEWQRLHPTLDAGGAQVWDAGRLIGKRSPELRTFIKARMHAYFKDYAAITPPPPHGDVVGRAKVQATFEQERAAIQADRRAAGAPELARVLRESSAYRDLRKAARAAYLAGEGPKPKPGPPGPGPRKRGRRGWAPPPAVAEGQRSFITAVYRYDNQPAEKQCVKCGVTKPKAEFYNSASTKDYLSKWCKACRKVISAAQYQKRKAALAAARAALAAPAPTCSDQSDPMRSNALVEK